jgi:hypothetical protein
MYYNMTDHLKPLERSRVELTETIERYKAKEMLRPEEAKALRAHLGIDFMQRSPAIVERCSQQLAMLSGRIIHREMELTHQSHLGKSIGSTGLLAYSVGREDSEPHGRIELMQHDLVVATAKRYPVVDRNVFIDKYIENDLKWLFEPLEPRSI